MKRKEFYSRRRVYRIQLAAANEHNFKAEEKGRYWSGFGEYLQRPEWQRSVERLYDYRQYRPQTLEERLAQLRLAYAHHPDPDVARKGIRRIMKHNIRAD